MPGCAKRVAQLCKECGLTLTGAGSASPYHKDPQDSHLRIAPTYPSLDEVETASDLLFMCYIGTIAVPWQVYMVPQFIMMRSIGLYDTIWALVALQSFSAFGVFLMRQFYMGIPNDLSEAARIDGLSEYGIWARIVLPLSKPAIATLCIFTFVNTWNDYMGPMIYLTTDLNKTIQVGLRRFIQAYSADYNLIMAASLCSLLPVTVVFLFLQRYFIEGIATTGMKG